MHKSAVYSTIHAWNVRAIPVASGRKVNVRMQTTLPLLKKQVRDGFPPMRTVKKRRIRAKHQ